MTGRGAVRGGAGGSGREQGEGCSRTATWGEGNYNEGAAIETKDEQEASEVVTRQRQ